MNVQVAKLGPDHYQLQTLDPDGKVASVRPTTSAVWELWEALQEAHSPARAIELKRAGYDQARADARSAYEINGRDALVAWANGATVVLAPAGQD